MQTRCPRCKSLLDVPTEYRGHQIKCLTCKQLYLAKEPLPSNRSTTPIPTSQPNTDPITCPNCASTQISADNKGFSGGKAVGGAVLLGPLGLLAGLHGRKKVMVACLNCGHRWRPGSIFS